jgi:hypothetical protein
MKQLVLTTCRSPVDHYQSVDIGKFKGLREGRVATHRVYGRAIARTFTSWLLGAYDAVFHAAFLMPVSWQTIAFVRSLQRSFSCLLAGCITHGALRPLMDGNPMPHCRLFQERAYIQGFPPPWFSSVVSQPHSLGHLDLTGFLCLFAWARNNEPLWFHSEERL